VQSMVSIDKFDKIETSVVNQLVQAGVAEKLGVRYAAEYQTAYYVLNIPDIKHKIVLEQVQEKVINRGLLGLNTASYKTTGYKAVAILPGTLSTAALKQMFVTNPNNVFAASIADPALTFMLHVLPGGTQADYLALKHGTKADVLMATAGDIGMI